MRRFRRILIVLAIAMVAVWLLLPAAGPHIESGSILLVDVSGDYLEATEPPLISRLLGDRRQTFTGLYSELRKAERDERLAAVVLRIGDLDIGWAKAQELRKAIARLDRAGRRTVAYVEMASFGGNLEYYVASAANGIYEAPGTSGPLVGLAAEYLFLGGLWEKLGVELEVERIGEYKTATEMLAGTEMSEPNREMANALLDSIDARFVADIAQARGLSEAQVREAIDRAPVSPEHMLKLGLIDGVAFLDEVIEKLGGGPLVRGTDYARVDPSAVGFAPVARLAIVYGSGLVVHGDGSTTPGGGTVLASETVSSALEQAAEDESIAGIILRIDSPGGSALASDIVWRAVEKAKEHGKPVIASFSDVAASGGYYVACGADEIVAGPGTLTGSIGVYVLRPVLRGLLNKLDIGVASLTRGAHADLLLASQPLSEGTRQRLRAAVGSTYELFLERVAAGRRLTRDQVAAVGRGRVWTGEQAKEVGLVDFLGGLNVAVQRAKKLLTLDPDADVVLVAFPPPKSLADQINEALRRVGATAEFRLPGVARRLREWLALAPEAAPALLPPFWVEIR